MFDGGINELKYGEKISRKINLKYKKYIINRGYLWNKIEELANLNQCYSDFTHSRHIIVKNELRKLGDVLILGHWGDVLFDSVYFGKNFDEEKQLKYLKKSLIKPGGSEIASELWKIWGLDGTFDEYFDSKISMLYHEIKIENYSAKLRAFKSLHWAPRWSVSNLPIFSEQIPILEPYYDDTMCKLICQIPENLLSNRKIQIEYIKRINPFLAKIEWQQHRPYNLYNYHWNVFPFNILFKIKNKLTKKRLIQRNWELQFIGKENEKNIEEHLFASQIGNIIPEKFVKKIYNNFKSNNFKYSHPLSMLLTLALFSNRIKN